MKKESQIELCFDIILVSTCKKGNTIVQFWMFSLNEYLSLSHIAIKLFVIFSTSYLHKTFSALALIETNRKIDLILMQSFGSKTLINDILFCKRIV